MEFQIINFMHILSQPSNNFNSKDAFECVENYLMSNGRILYSTISNIIYEYNDKKSEMVGNISTNIDALVKYSEDEYGSSNSDEEKLTKKTIIKIWDHITLANQQYLILKQSDDEYDKKFKEHIASYKNQMMKEVNIQMITMVGIFTALAFLIFGSISSLDGVFENLKLPLFKVMSVGLIWGICISNMIFVFLYCIGKMTSLNFKSNKDAGANVFQKYPIVWWTNLVLVSLLLFTSWGYFTQHTIIENRLVSIANNYPLIISLVGTIAILIIVFSLSITLYKASGRSKN